MKIAKGVLKIVATVYIAILLLLMIFETKLVYPGSKFPRGDWQPTAFEFEEVQFESADGTKLVGWYLPRQTTTTSDTDVADVAAPANETVLLCHGNAENVAQSSAYIGNMLRQTLNAELFVFDYRGYGKSEGSPAEAGILADAEAAYEWLQQRSGKRSDQIILAGHSIGGGPAVHLAAQHGAKALILQRTFSSLADAAQIQYPWLPIRYVIRNRYESATKIKSYDGPLIQSHGTADKLIPIELADKLNANSPSTNKQYIRVNGMTHLDPLPGSYWNTMRNFIGAID